MLTSRARGAMKGQRRRTDYNTTIGKRLQWVEAHLFLSLSSLNYSTYHFVCAVSNVATFHIRCLAFKLLRIAPALFGSFSEVQRHSKYTFWARPRWLRRCVFLFWFIDRRDPGYPWVRRAAGRKKKETWFQDISQRGLAKENGGALSEETLRKGAHALRKHA